MHEADADRDTDGPGRQQAHPPAERADGPARPARHVVVVGGGIAGLAAAHRLLGAGARVTLVEATARLGGKLYAGELAGAPVDLGAESVLARRPEAVELAEAVGLGADLQPPATATARLWTRGVLRDMPRGHLMGVPGDLAPLAASGILSAEGLARIAADAELPPTEVGEDAAIGEYVAARMGREVVDRLVEPLLGGVYAGDAYRISLRAAVPALYDAVRSHRTLAEAVRAVQAEAAARTTVTGAGATGAFFAGIAGGIGRLPLAVADACRAAGARILTGTPVREVLRTADGWRVAAGTQTLDADAVVLAVPAGPAARLLDALAPAAATELRAVEYASMALVTLAFKRSELPAALADGSSSGFLVPPVDGRTVKASTFSSNKWAWSAADPELFLLRTSVGRHGDERDLARDDADLVRASLADLGDAVGLAARPIASTVTRWDGGLPQYPVGHPARVARIRAAVAAVPGLAVCGALYDGVGIPACVASARAAADAVTGTPGADH
ncbi:protoporphyrinogen oxidase [Streptomyces antimicrobicus]|uniref:Coproporphyrinogen III oxidase n=1 Tax=Streptomyces antimicrobicus TaxID=2883108 RepID=A0ABS8BFU8_9ACTN|nr:protoporphyrinogen oxidase [Streptomyces antimicrobicus]MCB5183508.1 protoporphyrinogen oxidase [Streptomyces antimicrobicus]